MGKPCPRLASALAEAYKNESANSDDELKPYYEKLARVTGQPVRTVTDVEFIYNTLEIEVSTSTVNFFAGKRVTRV